jgi:hypothetical protein
VTRQCRGASRIWLDSRERQALLTGLQSVAGQQSTLFSAEWDSGSIATDQPTFGSSMTLNGAYSWSGDVSYHCRRAYEYTPVEPAFTAGGSTVHADDYVSAAATLDGTLLLAYVPPDHTGTITVEMTTLSGPSQARWLNPTTAAYTVIGENLPNSGTLVFTPPGDNGSGFSDWVLVIERKVLAVTGPALQGASKVRTFSSN